MKCIKCGNELQDNIKFCNKCGTKVEKNKNEILKSTKRKIKIMIISSVTIFIILILLDLTIDIYNSRKRVFVNSSKIENNKEEVTNIYTINKVGLYKNKLISNEKYNEKGDLISYTYNNDGKEEIYKLNYTYDNLGRVIKISTSGNAYIEIEYFSMNDKNKISEINYSISDSGLIVSDVFKYNINANEENFLNIEKYIYKTTEDLKANKNGTFAGNIGFQDKEINNVEYIISVDLDQNDNVEKRTVNLKEDSSNSNIFKLLEIEPYQYFNAYFAIEEPSKELMYDYLIAPDCSYLISHGRTLYEYKRNNGEYTINYNDNNRPLLYYNNNNGKKYYIYYQYKNINSNSYEYTSFLYTDNKDVIAAAGATAEQSNNYTILGTETTFKVSLDNSGQAIKYEQIGQETLLDSKEVNEKLVEYKNYLNKNKTSVPTFSFDELTQNLIKKNYLLQ